MSTGKTVWRDKRGIVPPIDINILCTLDTLSWLSDALSDATFRIAESILQTCDGARFYDVDEHRFCRQACCTNCTLVNIRVPIGIPFSSYRCA